jgi:S1-C subfamily serine protease
VTTDTDSYRVSFLRPETGDSGGGIGAWAGGFKARAVSLFVALLLAFTLAPLGATSALAQESQAVTADKNGVLNIVLYYVADDGTNYALQTGTGFLIDEEYLLTCYHVVNLDSEVMQAAAEVFGNDFRNHLVATAIVMRDLEIDLEYPPYNQSEATDFSILRLTQPIRDRAPLALGDSEEIAQTEAVYALGFPAATTEVGITTSATFTTSDVTVESGSISKILMGADGVDYIQQRKARSW